jgi:MFS family permease
VTTNLERLQRRTLTVLAGTQVLGGFGTVTGISVGVLLAASIAGTAVSGLAQSVATLGQGLLAVPVSRVMAARGRRAGLAVAYLTGTAGAVLTVLAAAQRSVPLLLGGLFLFGGAAAGNYQARYAGIDLARPDQRARHLSIILWATTAGAVLGPNLADATDAVTIRIGLPLYAGPFAASAVVFLLAFSTVTALLRPDPLLVARAQGRDDADASRDGAGAGADGADASRDNADASRGTRAAIREVVGSPDARLGLAAIVAGHVAMIAIMAMTPVYIGQLGHPHDVTLRLLGLTIGLHVVGMFAFSPVMGWLADRLAVPGTAVTGRHIVIAGGVGLLLAACAIAGTAGHSPGRLAAGLGLLGLGWSACIIAGSTLLSESVGAANRPAVQGISDLAMNLAAAVAGVLGGLVMAWLGFPALSLLIAVLTVTLVGLTARSGRDGRPPRPRPTGSAQPVSPGYSRRGY